MPEQIAISSLLLPDVASYPDDLTGSQGENAFVGLAPGGASVDRIVLTFDKPFTGEADGNSLEFGLSGHASAVTNYNVADTISTGTYTVEKAQLFLSSGTEMDYSEADLQAAGFTTIFAVAPFDSQDHLRPRLDFVDLPLNIVTTATGTSAMFGAFASDAGESGVQHVELRLDRPLETSAGEKAALEFGTDATGYYTYDVNVAVTSATPPGAYHVIGATVTDKAGNSTVYNAYDLAAIGMKTEFTVDDHTAPTLTSLSIDPIDVTNYATIAHINATAQDAAGNAAEVTLTFDHPLKNEVPQYHGLSPLIYDISQITFPLSGYGYASISPKTDPGTYDIIKAVVTDAAGNSTSYNADDLARLGFATSVNVTADQTPPTVTGLAVSNVGGQRVLEVLTADPGHQYGVVQGVVHVEGSDGMPSDVVLRASFYLPTPYFSNVGYGVVGSTGSYGSFAVTGITLTDYAGNVADLSASQLVALGVRTRFGLMPPSNDINGDGTGDILWRNVGGALSAWTAHTTTPPGGTSIQEDAYDTSASTSWSALGTFDWNGDGKADLLWHNSDGSFAVWTGAASGLQQSALVDHSVAASWSIAGEGDLDGDGKGDILWRNADGALSTWLSTGSGFQQNAWAHAPVSSGWQVEGVGDFNGDGRDDILWRNVDGAISIWASGGDSFAEGGIIHAPVDRSWHIVGVGDVNGDGVDDLVWHNDNGALSVWLSKGDGSTFQESSMNAGASSDWNVVQVADFNNDGRADLLWQKAGAVSVWLADGDGWQQNAFYDSVSSGWSIIAHTFPL